MRFKLPNAEDQIKKFRNLFNIIIVSGEIMVQPPKEQAKIPVHQTNGNGQNENGNIQESLSSSASTSSHHSRPSSTSSNEEVHWVFQCGVCGLAFPGHRDHRYAHQRNCRPNPYYEGHHQQEGRNVQQDNSTTSSYS